MDRTYIDQLIALVKDMSAEEARATLYTAKGILIARTVGQGT